MPRTLGLCCLVRLFLVFPVGIASCVLRLGVLLLLLLVFVSRLAFGFRLVRQSARFMLVLSTPLFGVRVLVVFLCSCCLWVML